MCKPCLVVAWSLCTVHSSIWLACCRADAVIDSSSEDFVAKVKEVTSGKGAYSAIDPVAGATTGKVIPLRRFGDEI